MPQNYIDPKFHGFTLRDRLTAKLAEHNRQRRQKGYDWRDSQQRSIMANDLQVARLRHVVIKAA